MRNNSVDGPAAAELSSDPEGCSNWYNAMSGYCAISFARVVSDGGSKLQRRNGHERPLPEIRFTDWRPVNVAVEDETAGEPILGLY